MFHFFRILLTSLVLILMSPSLQSAYAEGDKKISDADYKEFVTLQGAPSGEASGDPSHKGYATNKYETILRVKWTDKTTSCKPCEGLISAYNETGRTLFELKFQLKVLEDNVDYYTEFAKYIKDTPWELKGALLDKARSAGLNAIIASNTLKQETIPPLKAQIKAIEQTLTHLAQQIPLCENQCKGDGKGGTEITTGGDGTVGTPPLPFDWKGPYPEVCFKCAKLAARLNELPNLVLKEMALLEAAKGRRAFLEADLAHLRLINSDFEQHDNYHKSLFEKGLLRTDPNTGKIKFNGTARGSELVEAFMAKRLRERKAAQAKVKELEGKIKKEGEAIKNHEQNIEAIKKNFAETLKLYNDCTPTCQKKTACVFPDGQEKSLLIGPSSSFGTNAELKKKATGMAKQALGGLFGGGGMSFGGGSRSRGGSSFGNRPIMKGGGGSKAKGPPTVDDPTSGDKFTPISAGGTNMGFRSVYTDNGLLISSEITDSPDNGTFHIQWLEDVNGTRYLPTQYYIYSLYQDWRLTVWWTKDRYVNGEHVEHSEGREVTYGRNELGNFVVRIEGEEGVKNSIWHSYGFDTAVKGIDGLGTRFKVPHEVLAGPCPLRLVTHVSLPGGDPVVTQPVVSYLSMNPETMKMTVRPEP